MAQHLQHKKATKLSLLGIIGLMLMLLVIQPLAAIEIRLNSPHKIYSDENYVYVDAEGSATIISSSTLSNLRYNIPITITYYLELHERFLFFFSRSRANLQIINRITHDIWSGAYTIEKSNLKDRYMTVSELENAILNLNRVPISRKQDIDRAKTYFIKSRVTLKIKNYSSYYKLINNLLSIFKYRTTYYYSPSYKGEEMLLPINYVNKNN